MGKSSSIKIRGDEVAKKIIRFREFGIFENEISWLTTMSEFDRVPNLIRYNSKNETLVITYAGKQIDKTNVPKDWEDQAKEILLGLKKYNCSHNDIKPPDLTVIDGKLHLIDFGWATKIGDQIPRSWPPGLGGKYRLGKHKFNDQHALFSSIRFVLTGK